jgi:hypothetical protein
VRFRARQYSIRGVQAVQVQEGFFSGRSSLIQWKGKEFSRSLMKGRIVSIAGARSRPDKQACGVRARRGLRRSSTTAKMKKRNDGGLRHHETSSRLTTDTSTV